MAGFCDYGVPDYVQKICGIDKAGVIAVLLIDPSQTPTGANLSDPLFIAARVAASPSLYFRIKPSRGDYNGGTPNEEDGFGRDSTQVTGADHVLNFEFEGLLESRDFVEGVNRRKWKLAIITNGDLQYYVTVPTTVYITIMNPRGVKTGAYWKGTAKWASYDNPIVLTAPAGVYEQ